MWKSMIAAIGDLRQLSAAQLAGSIMGKNA